jgi:hypothetical protein
MTEKDTTGGMATAPRHVYGPRPVSALLPALTRAAFRRRSPAAAQIMADWPSIIGPALAAVTTPRRLVSGTLTLACTGPIATELQHLAGEVIARINAHLGTSTVQALRFVQTAPPPAPAPPAPRITPAATEAAEAAVAGLPRGELHDALVALGRAVLTVDTSATLRERSVCVSAAGAGKGLAPATSTFTRLASRTDSSRKREK